MLQCGSAALLLRAGFEDTRSVELSYTYVHFPYHKILSPSVYNIVSLF